MWYHVHSCWDECHRHLLYALPIFTEIGFSCKDGEVRLVGGDNPYEGRLEVCRSNRFGTACDDLTWNDADAQVACRNLGFEPEGKKIIVMDL